MTEINDRVKKLMDRLVDSGQEVGLQCAAYLDGEMIVDCWSGIADEATGRKVNGGSLFTCWSTTKGWAATCVHILADRGRLQYGDPISRYWPEFAAQGKSKATVLDALTHRVGVPQLPTGTTPEMMCDWDAMCSAIAGMKPKWTPGTKVGYHAFTYGWLTGEIVRRIDGRPIAKFAQDEICKPLGIDSFFMGIPGRVENRVAPFRVEPPPPDAPVILPGSLTRQAMPALFMNSETLNRPDLRRASLPGAGGIMNARAIARHYAMFAGYGELDGARILSKRTVNLVRKVNTDEVDMVANRRVVRGLAYGLGGSAEGGGSPAMGRSRRAFGHGGYGGSLGYADPEMGMSFGFTKTLLKVVPDPKKASAYLVAEEIRKALRREAR
ncbi:MAG: class A beta-lactamase-related serine hydrolase [Dehalococcoidia bacterium]|nr:class A beta-lactamase-related serine hydrolase [Dehalococcoidia bacterium]